MVEDMFLAGFVWAILLHKSSAKEVLYSDGWIPIASETIYNQLNHRQPTIASQSTQVFYTDVNKVNEELKANELSEVTDTAGETFGEVQCLRDCKDKSNFLMENFFKPNAFEVPTKHNNTSTGMNRKSKHVVVLEKVPEREENSDKSENEVIKRYEVIEADNLDIDDEESETKTTGNSYEPKNDFSNKFYDILSKYKIRKDEELTNYALSRRHKSLFPSITTVPPSRTNNLNHLPPDPLLAVLLSNYGFYLQGMYGIRNNYNNLYGYLASNNIHNNKPFGFYKIFSDTDSSH